MTWQEFQNWQRWDEFPERADNPPLTVDVFFLYEGKGYCIEKDYGSYHIYTSNWEEVFSRENLKKLLTSPISLFHGKSFADVCDNLEFK